MSFQVVCPNCQRAAIATPAQSGKLRKCTGCGSMYRVVPPAGEKNESPPQAARSNGNVTSVASPSVAAATPFLSSLTTSAVPTVPPAAPSNGFEYRAPLQTSADTVVQVATPYTSSTADDFWQAPVPPAAAPPPQLAWAAPTAPASAANQAATTGKTRTGSRRRKQGAAAGAGLGGVAIAIFFCLRLYARMSRHMDFDKLFNPPGRNAPVNSQPIFIESRPSTNNDPFFHPNQPALPDGFGREPGRSVPGPRGW